MRRKSGYLGGSKTRRTENRTHRVGGVQLVLCLALFLSVYIGKGLIPRQILQGGDHLLSIITANTDFCSALVNLGRSLSGDETLFCGLEEFCVAVFGNGDVNEPALNKIGQNKHQNAPILLDTELEFLNSTPKNDQFGRHYLYGAHSTHLLELQTDQTELPETIQTAEEADNVPAVGTVLLYADYTGDPLPANCTMDQISLGTLETVVPINGTINSAYGYRNHPITGAYQFHTGVDIDGEVGDPIAAFSSGTVEYVGEDDSYGLYFQLDHGNGIKSFYAHCDSVCVRKGQTISTGETVAKVGKSGTVTGPHLHFELKFHKLRVNPAYYLKLS